MMRSASGDADARGAASTFSIAIVPPGGDDVGGASGRRDAQLVPEGAPQAQQACGVLTWEGLTVTVRDAKGRTRQILKRADGIVHPGQLLAVMGARMFCLVRMCATHTQTEALCARAVRHAGPSGCGKRCACATCFDREASLHACSR
jgi:hypothetical protein